MRLLVPPRAHAQEHALEKDDHAEKIQDIIRAGADKINEGSGCLSDIRPLILTSKARKDLLRSFVTAFLRMSPRGKNSLGAQINMPVNVEK